jgi:hypothetical protein
MRTCFPIVMIVAFLLGACGQNNRGPLLATPATVVSSAPLVEATATIQATRTPTVTPPMLIATPAIAGFAINQEGSLSTEGALIAYQAGEGEDKVLRLADPLARVVYEYSFPRGACFATPFLAGLSPDAKYFVYFEGGWLENLYEHEYLRATTPNLILHVLDLHSGEIIFSAPLLSPTFPQDLAQVAETIKDDWWFTSSNYTLEEVTADTEEYMLDHIRNIAWSPDGSLLAFADQSPGPTTDLYLFSLEDGSATRVTSDAGHIVQTVWAPDSSALAVITNLYSRQAAELTTSFLSRQGTLLDSFSSQVYFFNRWHDAIHAIIYGGTDSGDYFDLKVFSTADGSTSLLWEGSYGDIAISPDLSTFLSSSHIPSAPVPPHRGLYLGTFAESALLMLAENWGWRVAWWGSEQFLFAASSIDEGTIGVTVGGERVTIDDRYWILEASLDGSYLAGYNFNYPSQVPGVLPGLRIFDGNGTLVEALEEVNVRCVGWDAASTRLAYQIEDKLYLWQANSGEIQQVAEQLNQEPCGFGWVRQGR